MPLFFLLRKKHMERVLGQQGNSKTFTSAQDAKLYYQNEKLETIPYLLDEGQIKIGRFTIKTSDDKLYILLDDEVIFRLDGRSLNAKRFNGHLFSGKDLS